MAGTLRRLPVTNRRKVGMTSSHHGPYDQGYTRTTMVGTEGRQGASRSQSQKPHLSPDRSLQLDCVKSESLVIADQHCRDRKSTRLNSSHSQISYAVFCLKKKKRKQKHKNTRNRKKH